MHLGYNARCHVLSCRCRPLLCDFYLSGIFRGGICCIPQALLPACPCVTYCCYKLRFVLALRACSVPLAGRPHLLGQHHVRSGCLQDFQKLARKRGKQLRGV